MSRIATLFISLLKTTGLSEKSASKALRVDDNEVVHNGSSKANRTVVNLFKNKKSKNLTYISNIGATRKPNFLSSNAKKIFNHLWLAFIKAVILWYFDLKSLDLKTQLSNLYLLIEKNVIEFKFSASKKTL